MLVNTLFQKADVFTKAVAGPLWDNAEKLLSILKTYNVLRTSSTGLKMSRDQALEPEAGGWPADAKPYQGTSSGKEGETEEPPTTEDSAVQGGRRERQLLMCLPTSHLY